MFNSIDEIYNHIALTIQDSLPEKWSQAWIEVAIDLNAGKMSVIPLYYIDKSEVIPTYFNILDAMPNYFEIAFPMLKDLMLQMFPSMHWNKCRFELYPDGRFSLDFKHDKNLEWLFNLPESEYENVDENLDLAIRQWDDIDVDLG